MSWKSMLLLTLVSSALAAVAGVIYNTIYSAAFFVDFNAVLGPMNIISASTFGCLLMAIGYKLILQWRGAKMLGYVNIMYSVLSFASIVGVLGFSLPLEVESPEMFPGLAIPMHFFPVLSFLTITPFFKIQYHGK